MTADILPDECDFCGQVLDEDDEHRTPDAPNQESLRVFGLSLDDDPTEREVVSFGVVLPRLPDECVGLWLEPLD